MSNTTLVLNIVTTPKTQYQDTKNAQMVRQIYPAEAKSFQEVYSNCMATLAELQSGVTKQSIGLDIYLRHRLAVYYEILGESIPEEFWAQIEKELEVSDE